MSNTYNVSVVPQVAPVVKVRKKDGIAALNPIETRTVVTASRFSDLIDVSVGNAVTGSVPVYDQGSHTFAVRPLTISDLTITSLSLASLSANSIAANVGVFGALTVNAIATANLSVGQLYANGSLGSNGQVLKTNGNTSFWDDPAQNGVTLVATGAGLSGGPIVGSGTISVVVGGTLLTNATGIHVNPNLALTNLTLAGNLVVQGTTTTVDTSNLLVKDNMIGLGVSQANTGTFLDLVDSGFYSVFGNTSAKYYAGLARVASRSSNTNPLFKLFGTNVSPDGSVIDTGASLGTLAAQLAAPGLTANSSGVAITANSTFNVAVVANTLQFDSLDCGIYT